MRAIAPLLLALALAGGCAAKEEAPPAGEAAATGGHPALNKLQETKSTMGDIEKKRADEAQRAAQGEAAGQDP